jgi:hypothetical protein
MDTCASTRCVMVTERATSVTPDTVCMETNTSRVAMVDGKVTNLDVNQVSDVHGILSGIYC